ncbi:MAG: hypothetical protein U5K69_03150 [Balneolaceae bacterium]|nr:hypothetical protein [Balneolaceae bacterium]
MLADPVNFVAIDASPPVVLPYHPNHALRFSLSSPVFLLVSSLQNGALLIALQRG